MADELLTITISGPAAVDKTIIARHVAELVPTWLSDAEPRATPLTVIVALTEDEPNADLRDFAREAEELMEFGGTLPRMDLMSIFIRLI
jgi:hypothetical protein